MIDDGLVVENEQLKQYLEVCRYEHHRQQRVIRGLQRDIRRIKRLLLHLLYLVASHAT